MTATYLINKISDFPSAKSILCFEKERAYCSRNRSQQLQAVLADLTYSVFAKANNGRQIIGIEKRTSNTISLRILEDKANISTIFASIYCYHVGQ